MDAWDLASNLTKTLHTVRCEGVLQSNTPWSEEQTREENLTIMFICNSEMYQYSMSYMQVADLQCELGGPVLQAKINICMYMTVQSNLL